MNNQQLLNQPSSAFVGASWTVMIIGVIAYCASLWSSSMMLNEKGFYFAVLCLALYAAVSLQKAIRDRLEGIPTSSQYNLISWAALAIAVCLQLIGLWNANIDMGEKGFYFMAFTMSIFGAITIQKNVRDISHAEQIHHNQSKQLNHDMAKQQMKNEVEKKQVLESPFRRKG